MSPASSRLPFPFLLDHEGRQPYWEEDSNKAYLPEWTSLFIVIGTVGTIDDGAGGGPYCRHNANGEDPTAVACHKLVQVLWDQPAHIARLCLGQHLHQTVQQVREGQVAQQHGQEEEEGDSAKRK